MLGNDARGLNRVVSGFSAGSDLATVTCESPVEIYPVVSRCCCGGEFSGLPRVPGSAEAVWTTADMDQPLPMAYVGMKPIKLRANKRPDVFGKC